MHLRCELLSFFLNFFSSLFILDFLVFVVVVLLLAKTLICDEFSQSLGFSCGFETMRKEGFVI